MSDITKLGQFKVHFTCASEMFKPASEVIWFQISKWDKLAQYKCVIFSVAELL